MPGTAWANEMNFCMNQPPGARSLPRSTVLALLLISILILILLAVYVRTFDVSIFVYEL